MPATPLGTRHGTAGVALEPQAARTDAPVCLLRLPNRRPGNGPGRRQRGGGLWRRTQPAYLRRGAGGGAAPAPRLVCGARQAVDVRAGHVSAAVGAGESGGQLDDGAAGSRASGALTSLAAFVHGPLNHLTAFLLQRCHASDTHATGLDAGGADPGARCATQGAGRRPWLPAGITTCVAVPHRPAAAPNGCLLGLLGSTLRSTLARLTLHGLRSPHPSPLPQERTAPAWRSPRRASPRRASPCPPTTEVWGASWVSSINYISSPVRARTGPRTHVPHWKGPLLCRRRSLSCA